MEQGTVKEGVFGFRLADNGSELYLGGTNADFYTGELEYHPVDKTTGFWQLENAEARVNGATVVDGREPHAVLLEIFTDEGVGTQVLPGVETKVRTALYSTSAPKEKP